MRVRRIDLANLYPTERAAIVRRSPVPDLEVRRKAIEIVEEVRAGGDRALHDANRRFGGGLAMERLRISIDEMQRALANLDADLVSALEGAAANIEACHKPQRPTDVSTPVAPGVTVERVWSPLRRVGIYVPGGGAAYPSSLLMGAIPAMVAGVAEIAVISPADADGAVSPAVLATASLLGIEEFYASGGAQAVGALAYGTETIGAVQKIVGPGNAWVTAAKLAVFGDVSIDLPAGPSEAVVVADHTADPRVVAADLLCQAEHGPDSPVALVTTDKDLADQVTDEMEALLEGLEREGVIRAALGNHGAIVLAPTHESALAFANDFAPEHLGLHTADPHADAVEVPSAGSVFIGAWTPESAGDYATGANHILPTGGLAASHGPLAVTDFGSWRQVQEVTREGLQGLRPIITTLADAEGLTAHRRCVDVRFESSTRGAP